MIDNGFKYMTWFLGALCVFLLGFACYSTGVRGARQTICDKVGGVYIQTYNNGFQCISATVIELK